MTYSLKFQAKSKSGFMNDILGLNVLCHFKNTGKFKHEMMAEVVSMSHLIFLYYQSIFQHRSKTRCQNAEKLFWVCKTGSLHAKKSWKGFKTCLFMLSKNLRALKIGSCFAQIVLAGLQNWAFYAEKVIVGAQNWVSA
jgi:hypothetical protein